MIFNQKVKVKWHSFNKQFYISKGFHFTKMGDELELDVNELHDGATVHVKFICDYCRGENQITENDQYRIYSNIMRGRGVNNKDCCNHRTCKNEKMNDGRNMSEKYKEKKIIKGTFAERFPSLLHEWNFEKNILSVNDKFSVRNKVWWTCEKGHEWEALISNRINSKSGCPYCAGQKACVENCLETNFPEVAKDWHPTKNEKLTPLNVLKHSNKKVWWVCEYGHEWKAIINSRTFSDNGCPLCKESKGERKLRGYLEKHKINFVPQFEFNGLIGLGGKNLKFDFAIFNLNNCLELMVEYDGKFHYQKMYKEDGHEIILNHDERKNQYCKNNNIPLLRIPYWEFDNIEEILTKELVKYNLILTSS